MSQETILVKQLSKTYQVPEREGGFGAAVRGFFKRFALSLFGGGEDFTAKKGFEAAAGSENAPSVSDAFKK